MLLDQFIPFGTFLVFPYHLYDQLLKAELGCPAQFLSGLGWVAQQSFNLGGTEVTWVETVYDL